jgi:hypothetical protein
MNKRIKKKKFRSEYVKYRMRRTQKRFSKAVRLSCVSLKECANTFRKFAEACKGVPYIE